MPQYLDYAAVYDATGQMQFSVRMLDYLEALLARHGTPKREMIDLACGTGTVAIGMAAKGWQVEGVDFSAQMLAEAQAKPGADAVRWRHADMRAFSAERPVSLVTCLYDSMNYMLTDEDLCLACRAAHDALVPGGLFVFDMNTLAQMEDVDGQSYVTESDDATVIMDCAFDDAQSLTTITMTCFQREDELYRRFRELHYEQAYPPEHIAMCLRDVGFAVKGLYACFSFDPPDDDTHRIVFVARRPRAFPLSRKSR